MSKEKKAFKFDSSELLVFAWKKRKTLILFTILGAIISVLWSYRITELYKSSVVLYPASSASVSKSILNPGYSFKQSFLEFGNEDQTDQLLQVLNSDKIKNKIIKKYNLLEHYKIAPNHKYKNYLLYEEFASHITFKRTKYSSVIVEVLDKDPKTAANIANDIAMYVDTCLFEVQNARSQPALITVETEYKNLQNQVKILEDSLNVLREMGILDYEYQAKELTKGYANAVVKGDERAVRIINEKLKLLAEYGGAYVNTSDLLAYIRAQMTNMKVRYFENKIEAEQFLPYKYVIDYAVPSDRKSYPKKSVIVLQSTIAAFFLTYLVLLIMSLIKNKK